MPGGDPVEMMVGCVSRQRVLGVHRQDACSLPASGRHEVVALVRRAASAAGEVTWDPSRPAGGVDPAALGPVDAIVNLAGAGIGDKRWTSSYRRELRESHVGSARAAASWRRHSIPLRTSSSASARWATTGGQRRRSAHRVLAGRQRLRGPHRRRQGGRDPSGDRCRRTGGPAPAEPGHGPLRRHDGPPAPAARQARPARSARRRAVGLERRLARRRRARPAVPPGAAGGSGAVQRLGTDPHDEQGVHPPARAAIHRPTVAPVPKAALRLVLGDFADDVLAGFHVVPERLVAAGFVFDHPDAAAVVAAALRRDRRRAAAPVAPGGKPSGSLLGDPVEPPDTVAAPTQLDPPGGLERAGTSVTTATGRREPVRTTTSTTRSVTGPRPPRPGPPRRPRWPTRPPPGSALPRPRGPRGRTALRGTGLHRSGQQSGVAPPERRRPARVQRRDHGRPVDRVGRHASARPATAPCLRRGPGAVRPPGACAHRQRETATAAPDRQPSSTRLPGAPGERRPPPLRRNAGVGGSAGSAVPTRPRTASSCAEGARPRPSPAPGAARQPAARRLPRQSGPGRPGQNVVRPHGPCGRPASAAPSRTARPPASRSTPSGRTLPSTSPAACSAASASATSQTSVTTCPALSRPPRSRRARAPAGLAVRHEVAPVVGGGDDPRHQQPRMVGSTDQQRRISAGRDRPHHDQRTGGEVPAEAGLLAQPPPDDENRHGGRGRLRSCHQGRPMSGRALSSSTRRWVRGGSPLPSACLPSGRRRRRCRVCGLFRPRSASSGPGWTWCSSRRGRHGGRVRTDVVERAPARPRFQLYNPAYPEGPGCSTRLSSGSASCRALVAMGPGATASPTRCGTTLALASARSPVGLTSRQARLRQVRTASRPDPATACWAPDSHGQGGLGGRVGDRLPGHRRPPVPVGCFLDDDWESRRFLDLVLRSFARAPAPAVPAAGTWRDPAPARRRLPGVTLRLPAPVTTVSPGRVPTRPATSPPRRRRRRRRPSLGRAAAPRSRHTRSASVTTSYHVADLPGDRLLGGARFLLVDGRGGNHPQHRRPDDAARSYASDGGSWCRRRAGLPPGPRPRARSPRHPRPVLRGGHRDWQLASHLPGGRGPAHDAAADDFRATVRLGAGSTSAATTATS